MLCLRSDQSEFMVLFVIFDLWIDQVLLLSLVINFAIAIFLLLP